MACASNAFLSARWFGIVGALQRLDLGIVEHSSERVATLDADATSLEAAQHSKQDR